MTPRRKNPLALNRPAAQRRAVSKGNRASSVLRYAALCAALGTNGIIFGAAAEPMQLRFASPAPAMSPITVGGIQPWAKEVNEAAPDALAIQVYAGPSVANFNNVYDRVVNAVVDAGFATLGGIGLSVPKTTVVSLPFEEKDSFNESLALWHIYTQGRAWRRV